MGTVLEDALKNRAYHLAKNIEDLTPGQIAEVEADPLTYLPEGYIPEEQTPEEEVTEPSAEAGEVVSEEVVETPEEVSEEVAETLEEVSEPPAEPVVRKIRKRG